MHLLIIYFSQTVPINFKLEKGTKAQDGSLMKEKPAFFHGHKKAALLLLLTQVRLPAQPSVTACCELYLAEGETAACHPLEDNEYCPDKYIQAF